MYRRGYNWKMKKKSIRDKVMRITLIPFPKVTKKVAN